MDGTGMINQGDKGTKGLNDLSIPLRECGEIATLRLSAALSEALEMASDQLIKELANAMSQKDRDALMDAADMARTRQNAIVCDFMRHFERRYTRACQQKFSAMAGYNIDFTTQELKVVEHTQLDDALAPGEISEAIQNASWQTLQRLTTQFQIMLNSPHVMPHDVPLGPKIIEMAVSDAIQEQLWRPAAKPRLARALRWTLASRVGQFYRDLTDHLSARDLRAYAQPQSVAPQHATPKPATSQPTARPAEPAPAPTPVSETSSSVTAPAENNFSSPAKETAPLIQVATREASPAPLPSAVEDKPPVQAAPAIPQAEEAASSPGKQAIPSLLKRLNKGFEAIKRVQTAKNQFLESRHTPKPEPDEFIQALTRSEVPPFIEAVQEEPQAPSPDPMLQEHSPEPAPSPAEPAQARQPEEILGHLKAGVWLEIQADDGSVKELKLAWVSPRKSLFLFTNRQGERAMSLSAEVFAGMVETGQARVLKSAEEVGADAPSFRQEAMRKTA